MHCSSPSWWSMSLVAQGCKIRVRTVGCERRGGRAVRVLRTSSTVRAIHPPIMQSSSMAGRVGTAGRRTRLLAWYEWNMPLARGRGEEVGDSAVSTYILEPLKPLRTARFINVFFGLGLPDDSFFLSLFGPASQHMLLCTCVFMHALGFIRVRLW